MKGGGISVSKLFRLEHNGAFLLIDCAVIVFSIFTAYALRFDFNIPGEFLVAIPYIIIFLVFLNVSYLWIYKIYKRLWRYASVGEFISIGKSVFLATVTFYLVHFVVNHITPSLIIPRSIYILFGIICGCGLIGVRLMYRVTNDNYTRMQDHHRKSLIVGAGGAGLLVARELKHSPTSATYPVVFVDDDIKKVGLEVHGIPVCGGRHDIPRLVEEYQISDIILAIPSASRKQISEIIEICKNTACKVKMMPKMDDIFNGKVSVNLIRDVSVEDLLGRDPIQTDMNEIASYLASKTVMVTGAGGSIGSELCRQIAKFHPAALLMLGHGENSIYEIEIELRNNFPQLKVIPVIADIQDRPRLEQIFGKNKIDVVFHAAAHKHVPLMESNPIEAIKNNILGTKNVADCSDAFGVKKFVMISTDKAVNPTNVMGATKRFAEMYIQNLDDRSETNFVAVRFGNVLGSRGSVIPLFKKQILKGGPVTVTHPEMIRYFMTIPEAVQLVIQAGALASGGEIFVLDMGKPVKISDLAKDLIRLSGFEPDKDIAITYTGIRPGEKLFEEILTGEEGVSATKHDRIYIGQPVAVRFELLNEAICRFREIVSGEVALDHNAVKEILGHYINTYKYSSNVDNESAIHATKEAIRASLELVATIDSKSKM